jgi:hypothetical protein
MSSISEHDLTNRPAEVLQRAKVEGGVIIRCDDGSELTLRVSQSSSPLAGSPLDVGCVPGLKLAPTEIVEIVRAGRERLIDAR